MDVTIRIFGHYAVGEKRNAAAASRSHEILFVWDDDDIFLPHRLSYTINTMSKHDRYRYFFKPARALILNDGVLMGPKGNLFHSGSAWTRCFFDKVGGYPHMGSGQDWGLEKRFEKDPDFAKKNFNEIPPEDIFYIYRWSGTGTFHLSGFGQDKEGQKTGNEKVRDYVRKKIELGLVKEGSIELVPRWQLDYVDLVKDYVRVLATK